jgi:hypothetical protein
MLYEVHGKHVPLRSNEFERWPFLHGAKSASYSRVYNALDSFFYGVVQELQKKASERNPDEFYFAMEHSSTRNGVHVARFALKPHQLTFFNLCCRSSSLHAGSSARASMHGCRVLVIL